ncbi:hypothetical protein K443DRAFT_15734 [Laccaria amethystina LaAM-08-1]|uniref:Uncharacterized protein n=1 Tax=Laccaria amethystina LaAM-08-1 TaxID=1095629 RepID=A0A0C9WX06_9AGAR|nr:hypothetical protein K443DRAFT_15734 [Laccaria amethystina LaAM-08-1]
MVSEYSLDPDFPFDYNTFDDALGLIPRGAPQVTTLHISFYPEAGVAEWLEKHPSHETSPLAALEGVTTLNLCWNIGKLCEHAQCARSSDSRPKKVLVCDALALPGQKMSAQTLNLQKRAATPLNLQKEAAVEIGAPFGAVDDQLPRRRRKAAVDRHTVSGAINDQLPRRRRKATIEIGAPFLRCRRSARHEEGKLPLRIADS